MSRHQLSPRPGAPDVLRVFVGWDRPLQTFFSQVFVRSDDPEDDDGVLFFWKGTEPGELSTPEAAIDLVAQYALVPSDLAATLRAEMEASRGERDGPHQADMKKLMFGSIH
ncbi:MAG: hypothetical protein E6Q40_14590 [Cupriavidus sp.]|nr:MAG: hypothetical protein E6Q40_14590 [Cupriavidus sp.]